MNAQRIAAASGLHDSLTDLQMLRATAGLPLYGELSIPRLQQQIAQCCRGDLASCPSCAAVQEVIDAEGSPEDRDFGREPHEGMSPLERWA